MERAELRFVIQKHAARRLHYDFRLEVDGVFKSWAVPKGPSVNPREKRLAIAVEDHSLAYGDFEGTIPAGQYGAGTVQVWDKGTYANRTQEGGRPLSMAQALERGRAVLWLEGRRLRGGYTLTRFGPPEKGQWLLTKMPDEYADTERNILL
jgi:DNA ligase D-like protein (predicted 3'-phosphoesterase)